MYLIFFLFFLFSGEEATMEVTPDETDLEGLTEEEKEKQRLIWQKELAKVNV